MRKRYIVALVLSLLGILWYVMNSIQNRDEEKQSDDTGNIKSSDGSEVVDDTGNIKSSDESKVQAETGNVKSSDSQLQAEQTVVEEQYEATAEEVQHTKKPKVSGKTQLKGQVSTTILTPFIQQAGTIEIKESEPPKPIPTFKPMLKSNQIEKYFARIGLDRDPAIALIKLFYVHFKKQIEQKRGNPENYEDYVVKFLYRVNVNFYGTIPVSSAMKSFVTILKKLANKHKAKNPQINSVMENIEWALDDEEDKPIE